MPLLNPSAPQQAQSAQGGQLPELPAGPSLDSVRGPVEIPLFETWQLVCISLLSALLIAILISWIVRAILKRNSQGPELPPHQIAKRAIEQADGDDQAFALELTQAVRSYFNRHLKRPILAQTSQETLSHLPPDFPVTAQELQAFFQRCDTIKFSNAKLTAKQRIELSDTAAQFIDTVHHTEKEASKT